MYIYESCMGDLFWELEPLTLEDRYCETCGGYDNYIARADTKEEVWNLLQDKIDRELTPDEEGYGEIINTGGYDKEYVKEFIDSLPPKA
ncbi:MULTISPECIES: hypothetical protein [unclassified Clostridium]|uniref:hypothetical protein n=1 Tax=unclassified Clostridium TaxID=2614128 RepID=UPI0025C12481|nr:MULTISPECIES: hypothetical protein [unclassified Clostridium]